ncbi:TVP38/TMEM64 family protein [Alteromonas sp. CYL-A6]|uniref:TVP38/TMEM64 family protein n=1 Tax=Alteromonas nitratireducens TaxID=3390813 RepID=UPI0034B8CAE7
MRFSEYKRVAMVRIAFRLSVLLLLSIGISELLQWLPSMSEFDQAWVDAHTRDSGFQGAMIFTGVAVLLLSAGLPRQLVAFLAGYAFGVAEGFLYGTLAAVLSCVATFYLSRLYARPLVVRWFLRRVAPLNRFLVHHPFTKSLIIRLLPVGNNLVTNLLAGATHIRALPFFMGSMLGYMPQMLIFSLLGKGVLVQSYWKIVLSIVLMGISGVLGVYLYKQRRAAFPEDTAPIDENQAGRQTL